MRVMRTFLVVALMATAGWMPACAAERVDLLLVLPADISRSVDAVKFQLQRSGYAAAFSNPRVIDAIRGGPSRLFQHSRRVDEWGVPIARGATTRRGRRRSAPQPADEAWHLLCRPASPSTRKTIRSRVILLGGSEHFLVRMTIDHRIDVVGGLGVKLGQNV